MEYCRRLWVPRYGWTTLNTHHYLFAWQLYMWAFRKHMATTWHGNAFHITDPLLGNSPVPVSFFHYLFICFISKSNLTHSFFTYASFYQPHIDRVSLHVIDHSWMITILHVIWTDISESIIIFFSAVGWVQIVHLGECMVITKENMHGRMAFYHFILFLASLRYHMHFLWCHIE